MKYDKTLDAKRLFVRPDGEEVVDLTQQNFNPRSSTLIIEAVEVHKDFEMRPDLVAKSVYSTEEATEMLLKQSGISNPFSLEQGDLIFLQDLRDISTQFGDPVKEDNIKAIRNQYIDSTKGPEVDQNLKAFENRKKVQKPKKANTKKEGFTLPPNFAQEGEQEIKLVGGKVIYGGDVTKNQDGVEIPLSKSEFLAKILKDKKE